MGDERGQKHQKPDIHQEAEGSENRQSGRLDGPRLQPAESCGGAESDLGTGSRPSVHDGLQDDGRIPDPGARVPHQHRSHKRESWTSHIQLVS